MIKFIKTYWKLLLVLLITLSALAVTIYIFYFKEKIKPIDETNILEESNVEEEKEQTEVKEEVKTNSSKPIFIDIKGEVITPGIYQMSEDNRVIDAINISGGLTKNADTSVNNLSMKLKDEMVIIIYSKNEVINFTKTKEKETIEQTSCKEQNNITNDSCITSSTNKDLSGKININTATKEELSTINGIGETKAEAIIAYRNQNGMFKNVEEIKNITDIGDSIYEKIKNQITI